MSINKTKYMLSQRPLLAQKQARREQLAIKTRQLLGGDNFVYENSAIAVATFTVAAGQQVTLENILTSLVPGVSLFPLFTFSIYVGVESDANELPIGSALTTSQRNDLRYSFRQSLGRSSEDGTINTWIIHIYNATSVSETLTYKSQVRYPKVQAA